MAQGRGVICSNCEAELEGDVTINDVVTCPECNKNFQITKPLVKAFELNNPTKSQIIRQRVLYSIGVLLVILFIIAILSPNKKPKQTQMAQTQPQTTSIDNSHSPQRRASKFAADKIAEYEIAKRNGDKMTACVLAGIIKQAFLTAQDEQHYNIWRVTEETRCEEAGVPKAK